MTTSKQRRDAERRRVRRQAARRAERARSRRRNTVIISVIGVLAVVGVVVGLLAGTSGDDTKNNDAASPPPTTAASSGAARTPTYPCTWTKSSAHVARKVQAPATTRPPKSGKVSVSVRTTRGAMVLMLDRAAAPCTVASFVSLVRQGYYDASPCHRLTTQTIYVLQCGDSTGQGSGAPGYTIPDEATGRETYPAGTIAMARSREPHSGASQFFIVYKDSPNLMQDLGQRQYTVFGKVTSGLPVVTDVAKAGSDNAGGAGDGKPKTSIVLAKLALAA